MDDAVISWVAIWLLFEGQYLKGLLLCVAVIGARHG